MLITSPSRTGSSFWGCDSPFVTSEVAVLILVANPRLVVAELGTLRDRALLNTSLSGVVSDAARLVLVLRG